VARAVRRHPGRFLGVAYVDPTHLAPEELMRDLRRRVERQGFVGLKPYLKAGLRYTDPLYAPCWAYADARGLYTLLHMEGAAGPVASVGELATQYPRAQWVVAHSGGSFAMARSVAALMRRHANVWAELTLTAVTNGVIEWLVAEVGADRILFGTDAPMRDPRPQLGWVVWADLPLADRRRILGGNFARLLARRTSAGMAAKALCPNASLRPASCAIGSASSRSASGTAWKSKTHRRAPPPGRSA
jgi:predicted TIM-barrel fold metal-dependent hydrolase